MKDESAAQAGVKKMLDEVTWGPNPVPEGLKPGELYATHSGVIRFNGIEIRVHQLNDGQRILDADDLAKLFGIS